MFGVVSDFMINGEAKDGEAVLKMMPQYEEYAKENYGEWSRKELYWNLKDPEEEDSPFVFEIHFWREELKEEEQVDNTSESDS